MKYMTPTDWQNYILGISTRGIDAMRTNAIIRGWVTTYLQEANEMIALLEKTRTDREENTHVDMELVGNEDERITDNIRLEMLLVRWYQIRKLCEDAVQALG
jgi:ribosomal lysine N-methyltransferase 2